MFWADKVAEEIVDSKKYKPYHVDDMKTPSGRIHIGALRGVVVHDLIYQAIKDKGQDATYTYVFENHDPMDALPVYLPKEKFEKYMGMPLYKVPSPEPGFKNFAEYYALEFKQVFNTIGSTPKIIWALDLYLSGQMNDEVRVVLDNAQKVRGIYEELYKKELPKNWYPFNVVCPNCGKIGTTTVTAWDGQEVAFTCDENKVKWAKGCGYSGKTSPFGSKDHFAGKMPWKVEWAVKWKVIGVTIEGAGKDHMSRGGSHDLASLVATRVLNYPIPYPIAYEWFLIGGRKMSTSKGVGAGAAEILEVLPPQLVRFLMVKTNMRQQINFDPSESETIPKLFDEYQKAYDAYVNKTDADLARIFELSQVDDVKKPPAVRFSQLAQWVQAPNMQDQIQQVGAEEWAKYALYWVEHFAPEKDRFRVKMETPDNATRLSVEQKVFLKKVAEELNKKWDEEEFQKQLFEWAKETKITSSDAFSAIYLSLLGKNYGPKAGWIILTNQELVKKRFEALSE